MRCDPVAGIAQQNGIGCGAHRTQQKPAWRTAPAPHAISHRILCGPPQAHQPENTQTHAHAKIRTRKHTRTHAHVLPLTYVHNYDLRTNRQSRRRWRSLRSAELGCHNSVFRRCAEYIGGCLLAQPPHTQLKHAIIYRAAAPPPPHV